ncbi:hypothetical protein L1887_60489 [Cichorium endivia]|nr:hypothetical protein L1887_60489 [Cichorium endivia]
MCPLAPPGSPGTFSSHAPYSRCPSWGQAHPGGALQETRSAIDPEARSGAEMGADKLDFEPSRLQRAHVFSKLSADAIAGARLAAHPGFQQCRPRLVQRQTGRDCTALFQAGRKGRSDGGDQHQAHHGAVGLAHGTARSRAAQARPACAQRPSHAPHRIPSANLTTFVAAHDQSVATPQTPVQQQRATNSDERSALHDLASVVETVHEGSGWNLLDGFEQATTNKDHRLNNDVLATVPLPRHGRLARHPRRRRHSHLAACLT